MKTILLLLLALFAIGYCELREVDESLLEDRDDGLWYVQRESRPFSGIGTVSLADSTGEHILSKRTYKNGKYDGERLLYYDNGNLSEKSYYKDGYRHSNYFSYDENGKINGKGNFTNGNGQISWYYENGKVNEVENYKNDKKNGEYLSYYENGKIEEKANYKDDLLDGNFISYNTDGLIVDKLTYQAGKTTTGEPRMAFVKGGTFETKTISDFYIGIYEVTQEEWITVMDENPSYNDENQGLEAVYPVSKVSWYDCQTFIKKLNAKTSKKFRLPTMTEWDYAASGGNKSQGHPYSGSVNIDDVAWYRNNSEDGINLVGTKQSNELGIYDMTGNVWEWCQDPHPANISTRVMRGGSYENTATFCRLDDRRWCSDPSYSFKFQGLRLVREP